MDNPIERVRISKTAEDQLVQLKRSTQIKQWNILCRWAFCRSLAEPSVPSPVGRTHLNLEKKEVRMKLLKLTYQIS